MTAIMHEWETLPVADGSTMDVYVTKPVGEGDHHAAVIVLQEIWGVNSHIREVADRFARLGYVTAAPDIFHRTAPRFDAEYSDLSGLEHARKVTDAGSNHDLAAVHAYLNEMLLASTDEPGIAACGFCFGGRLAYQANALLPLACAVSFYGGGIHTRPDLAAQQHGPLLLFWGGKDSFILKEHRRSVADALDAGTKRFTEVNVGHADHGFFCDQRKSYDSEAAHEAWGMVTAFFSSNLDPN